VSLRGNTRDQNVDFPSPARHGARDDELLKSYSVGFLCSHATALAEGCDPNRRRPALPGRTLAAVHSLTLASEISPVFGKKRMARKKECGPFWKGYWRSRRPWIWGAIALEVAARTSKTGAYLRGEGRLRLRFPRFFCETSPEPAGKISSARAWWAAGTPGRLRLEKNDLFSTQRMRSSFFAADEGRLPKDTKKGSICRACRDRYVRRCGRVSFERDAMMAKNLLPSGRKCERSGKVVSRLWHMCTPSANHATGL